MTTEPIENRCEHSEVKIIRPLYCYDIFGIGECLKCSKRGIILFPQDYVWNYKKDIYTLVGETAT